MAIYIFIFIYIFALIFFFDLKSAHPNHSKKAKLHYHILEVIFILVVGLSYRVGSDTIGYMDGFPYYPTFVTFSFDNLSEYTREPLWVLLNITIRSTFNDFSFVMLFCAITINVVIFKLIKENSLYPFSTLLLYYLLGWINVSFEMLRQTCAVAFIIWGCLYLLKGDRKAFFIRSFPAIFFHISGIFVVLLLLAFSYIKINKVSLMACFSIFFIGILLKNSFGDVLNMINIISAGSGEVYAEYLDSENYGLLNRSFYGYVENFCLNLFLPGSVVVYYYRKGINHNFIRILLVFVVLSSLSSVLGIIHRMAAYLQYL